jgi:hypothetical protein
MLRIIAMALAAASLHGIGRGDDEREARPRFKGVELYSWRDDDGTWNHVLLSGTNRVKTAEQVKAAEGRVRGTEALKKALSRLAIGEQVTWMRMLEGFDVPTGDTRKEVEKAARDAQIDLQIPDKPGEVA